MAYSYSFEKLQVWQKSIHLVKNIYQITKQFPKEERFGFTSQMQRSAVSIPTNIAEGVSRKTSKAQAHFSTIAFGSLTELVNLLIIARELDYISISSYNSCREHIDEISRMLIALRKSQES
ncbi:four helix bundle protein [Haliscomenobacter hydrossis]|uniref:S23 ribosomal protein n=1 Tax=Haliscomenobacter hydrossis (strain ATCC 27775 / DSM 1100 / LMG 10767 / O) TaxID=760192 RepID=F4KRQ9_HALH1|nr:four helix bundle protein [Haliscomenobacter hydrossis]AEE50013.1 S23 ribosomal protein [Haliscomenobacter hydrossis DSM 1100]